MVQLQQVVLRVDKVVTELLVVLVTLVVQVLMVEVEEVVVVQPQPVTTNKEVLEDKEKSQSLGHRQYIKDYQIQPSLVHGDLWGGNVGFTSENEPVIFDPATYFGDREVDIAMTELFAGFPLGTYTVGYT